MPRHTPRPGIAFLIRSVCAPLWQIGLAILMCSITAGAAEPKAPARPNILFLLADDLRGDVMSVYGGPVPTPHLERLAARGLRFRRATCGFPICHVSRTELLTGRWMVSEASRGEMIPFQKEWMLWPQWMRQHGWHTVHAGKWHVRGTPSTVGYDEHVALFMGGGLPLPPLTIPKSATNRDITGYVGWIFKSSTMQSQPEQGVGLTPRTDRIITDAALDSLRRHRDQPIFMQVNFTAPHDPLHWPTGREHKYPAASVRLPKNFREQHPFEHGNLTGRDEVIVPAPRSIEAVQQERAVYYALVEELDAQVGDFLKLIEASPHPNNWLVIFASDQGLALGSHGLMGKHNQYDHTVNTPLLIAGPGVPQGECIDAQCALRDLYPTVCELTGLQIPPSVEGKSLVPLFRDHSAAVHDLIYGYYNDTQRMVRTNDGWKLIWYPQIERVQLFHIAEDPEELRDLGDVPEHAARKAQLLARLQGWLKGRGDPVEQLK